MSSKMLLHINTPMCIRVQNIFSRRYFASNTTQKDITVNDEKSIYEAADETPIFKIGDDEETPEIQQMRNKSRLQPQHRNILNGTRPYKEPMEWYHHTVKYKRRMLGRYGMKAVDVPAGFAWPTQEEIEDMKEYERVAYPYSIQEEWARIDEKNKKAAEAIKAREADISDKMLKMGKWIADLNARTAKKEADMLKAKELKERLIAEVRHELGFNVPIYDEKFKEALLQKEKAEKKKQKEMKKKTKEEKLSSFENSEQIDKAITEPS